MIASFDSHSGIVYIQVDRKRKIKKTIEFDPHTILEFNDEDQLAGIEMIKPKRSILNCLAKRYGRWELSRVNLDSLLKAVD